MRNVMPCLALIAVGFLLLGTMSPVLAGESLEDAVKAFLDAPRGKARLEAARAVLDLSPAPEALEAHLKKGRAYDADVPKGWSVLKNRASDGRERPFHLLVPGSYDPARKYPLLFNMHGGVGGAALIPDEMFSRYREQMWAEDGRRGAYLLVLPMGQKGAEWWSATGLDNLLGIADAIKRRYNVDENRVFTTGFSDGGSGSFFLALNHTTPFAGFVALNGFPPVAGAGGFPVYLPNSANKPMYVVNTTADGLYPSRIVTPFIDAMKKAGAPITYKVYPDIGHRPDYWPQEHPKVMAFLKKTIRNPLPRTLTWETADPKAGRCHWVRIDEVADVEDNHPDLAGDFNPIIRIDRVRIGIYIDQDFEGEGVRVDKLADGETPASRMDLRAGDVIVAMAGEPVASFDDLRAAIGKKKAGDGFTVKVKRGDEQLELKGAFDPVREKAAFVRQGTAGRVLVRCEGNRVEVKARHVAKYTLFVSRDLFDMDAPLEVITNGKRSFRGHVAPDTRFMILQAAEDDDRSMVFWGKVTIDVRKALEEEKGGGEEDDSEF